VGLESVISTPVAPPPPKAASPAPSSNSSSTGSSSSQASAGSQSGPSSAADRNSANSTSASSASRAAARNSANSGKSGNSASNTANTQGKNSAASSQANQSGSSAQTQSTAAGAAASAKNGATQPGTTSGPSFIEALAQSQASAADSATAATTATANATADGIVGSGGKGKAAKGGDTDPTAASFGFLSQSLVAAMAGGQQPNTTPVTTNGDSSDGVSLASGSNIESIVANLTDGAADALQGADGDGKAAGSATGASASAADGSASGTGAFQAQMGVTSHFQANATANTQTTNDKVSSPVGTTAFNDEVGGKVTWMASQRVQSASLQISPEHMGPVEVRISMQDGATSVAFSANHADTRAALEQALPRLREMFATQGLTLSDASVSQQSPRGQSQKQAVAAIGAIGGTSTDDDSTSSVAALSSARLGLVDTYA
jgi:flagellar hook-length control protein FliK